MSLGNCVDGEDLIGDRRFCYMILDDQYEEGKGYRPSVVIEDRPGHYPNGGGDVEPWYWGFDLEAAKQIAADRNAKLGLTPEDVAKIIGSSMRAA